MAFTIFYVIACLAGQINAILKPAARHGFLNVRYDYPTDTATRTLAVASTGPTLMEDHHNYPTAEATDTLFTLLLPKVDWPQK